MNIILEITDNKAILYLKDKKNLLDKLSWSGNLNLSEKLLVKIDNILIKNNLKPSDIDEISLKSNISDNLTTIRIAKIVAKTFNFAKSVN